MSYKKSQQDELAAVRQRVSDVAAREAEPAYMDHLHRLSAHCATDGEVRYCANLANDIPLFGSLYFHLCPLFRPLLLVPTTSTRALAHSKPI